MKYSTEAYEISDAEGEKLRHRRQAYIEDEQFKGSAFITMVSPYGVMHNAQWNSIQSEVTLEDLFQI